MKKIITLVIITITFLLSFAVPTKAMYDDISNIVSSLGETMDQIGINYHTRIEGSYVIYSTSSKLKKPIKAIPEVHEWSREQKGDYPAFEKRYVCSVNLTGLELYTTYYYQIIAGSSKSDICSFNTGRSENITQFAWITDSQTYAGSYGLVDNVINNLELNVPNLSFILNTGDVTDRAGKEEQWNGLFKDVKSLKDLPMSTIPGNHEYYTTSDSGYDSPEIYNQYFNNPKNSFEGRINSSYYFKYNNILFIMIDAIKNEYVAEQKAWVTEVLENNSADFIIVGIHAGLITGGNYSSDAKRMSQAFQGIFENYSVDLVLSGHEHAFCVQKTRFQGEIDEEKGVTHVIGPAVGNKTYKASDRDMDYVQNLNYAGCIVTVTTTKLTLAMYNTNGDKQYEFTLKNRRNISSNFNEENFLKSLKIERDEEKEIATLVWNQNIYGYVEKINISGKEVNMYVESNLKPITREISLSNINDVYLGANYIDTNYYYDITITMKDGRILTKNIEIINNEDLLINKYKVTFTDNNGNILKEEIVKEGEAATAPTPPNITGYTFIGWDKEFDEITSDLVITTLYEEIIPDEPINNESGCKKDLVYLATSIISLTSLGFVIFRKKD